MSRVFRGLCVVALPLLCFAADQKVLTLQPASAPITVDGIIEPAWASADSAHSFSQLQPYYGQPPRYHTVARLLTSPDALYCLIVCEQPEHEIDALAGMLDQFGGDAVSLMIDTFGDRQTAYKFAVSSGGVRSDSRLLDDARNRDYSWDGVWFAASKVYPWGYVVEMEIPYRSIRYDGTLTEWGLDFDRWTPGTQEDLYWCPYEQSEGQRISKFGRLLLNGARPAAHGLNLEIYPVGLVKADRRDDGTYQTEPTAGIDLFYNPSEKLTFQLTGNPDFAQIEADPFEFNISRYETYFSERRPFFIEGNEIFMASGRERSTGFYQPLELFYSRRIGKALPDGSLVPLLVGTKASGRAGEWQYGGFYAMTGEESYTNENGIGAVEEQAHFVAGRVKKQILDNSSVGVLFVGKRSTNETNGVLDIDGAFRTPSLQISYQLARSISDGGGDFAGSAGLVSFTQTWAYLGRIRAVGKNFDVSQVGFVPWQGTVEGAVITGPMKYFDEGPARSRLIYFGAGIYYEEADRGTDQIGIVGINYNFRTGWGMETTISGGKSRDAGHEYGSYEISHNMWYNTSSRWDGDIHFVFGKSYNFRRGYLANYGFFEGEIEWKPLNTVEIGTSLGTFVEWTPSRSTEEITYNARPFVSVTPVNNLNVRLYVDNLFLRSTDRLEHVLYGFLFSYNFLPKSWVHLAINEIQERGPTSSSMETMARAAVLKVRYLYYL